MADAGNRDSPLVCVVEIPKGSRNKYEFDPQLGGIKFDRLLMSAATYPTVYGYLRGTLGRDGDPLDARPREVHGDGAADAQASASWPQSPHAAHPPFA
jgi:hypothetical protein